MVVHTPTSIPFQKIGLNDWFEIAYDSLLSNDLDSLEKSFSPKKNSLLTFTPECGYF